jgi:hypothetical protein
VLYLHRTEVDSQVLRVTCRSMRRRRVSGGLAQSWPLPARSAPRPRTSCREGHDASPRSPRATSREGDRTAARWPPWRLRRGGSTAGIIDRWRRAAAGTLSFCAGTVGSGACAARDVHVQIAHLPCRGPGGGAAGRETWAPLHERGACGTRSRSGRAWQQDSVPVGARACAAHDVHVPIAHLPCRGPGGGAAGRGRNVGAAA